MLLRLIAQAQATARLQPTTRAGLALLVILAESACSPTPDEADANIAEATSAAALSPEEIRSGLTKAEAAAVACGARHDARAGTSVVVKLSISGRTGGVTVMNVSEPHTNTELGGCVKAALATATFRTFPASSVGVSYPIRF